MEKAAAEEKARRHAALDPNRKRPPSAPAEDPSDLKRPKLEHDPSAPNNTSFLATVDFTKLPVSLITDLVVANLQVFTEPALNALVQAYRQSKASAPAPTAVAEPTPQPAPSARSEPEPEPAPIRHVKEEPLDPLQMDIDEEEFEFEPDRLNQQVGFSALHTIRR